MRLSDLDLKKTSGSATTTCPYCSPTRKKSKQKCFSVNIDKGLYYCSHCGIGGIFEDMKPRETKEDKEYILPKLNTTGCGDKVLNYLLSRGISVTTVNENKITQHARGAIEFNYYEFEELVNIKYRSVDKKAFRQHKGGKPIMYGFNDIVGQKEIIITEGEIDKLSIYEAGFKNCASVPMGAPNPNDKSQGKLKCFELAEPYIDTDAKIIIAVDDDVNGNALKDEIARRFGKERCYVVDWGGYKDANECLVEEGKEYVKACLLNAKEYPIEGIIYLADSIVEIDDLYTNGVPPAYSAGMGDIFDRHYKVKEGYLTIVTGIPTHGKSNFVEHLMVNLMQNLGWGFGVYSPEHYPVSMYYQRLARIYTGKSFFSGYSNRMTKQDLADSIRFMHDKLYPAYANQSATIDDILDLFAQLVFKYGIKGCIIDPWTDVEHRTNGKSETLYISESLSKIKRFNQKYGVHTWLIAHPTKMRKEEVGEKYMMPTLYDCAGSANFYNRADFGLTVYRNPDNSVTVDVQKVKFEGIYGMKGQVDFNYDPVSCRYDSRFSNKQPVKVFENEF